MIAINKISKTVKNIIIEKELENFTVIEKKTKIKKYTNLKLISKKSKTIITFANSIFNFPVYKKNFKTIENLFNYKEDTVILYKFKTFFLKNFKTFKRVKKYYKTLEIFNNNTNNIFIALFFTKLFNFNKN